MKKEVYLGVAIGGGIGALLRFLLTNALQTAESFPSGTLSANLIGCFLLSFLYEVFSKNTTLPPVIKTAITTGGIGAFTTFSTLIVDSNELFHQSYRLALLYLGTTIIGGLVMTTCGFAAGRRFT
ncbi:fluoride efflux transporter CrcB [Halobacillus salinarum]|uniref:Fluoride-specific ion channel FluC n=1 Tax=Halobacillus salinarum TaxID=2932257 RepID=A0ABY4ENH5_9BACI|nr:fluoride efflux transporter CrcB [Halobacillus salinarum]UOQ46012.1 fluoride efflux transporter CrcB [Halobacillus salinarum]